MKSTICVRVCILLALFLSLGLVSTGAQEPEPDLDFGSHVQTEVDGFYSLEPDSIPMHELVKGLFPRIGRTMIDRGNLLRGQFLQDQLGIAEGTAQETALVDAIVAGEQVELDEAKRASRIQELLAIQASEGAEASVLRNRELVLEDARKLGAVWGQLIVDLGGSNSPAMAKINRYIENRRSGISISSNNSFEDAGHIIWTTERAFQEGVDSVLGQNEEGDL